MYSLPLPTRFAQSPNKSDGGRALSLDWDRIKRHSRSEPTSSTSSCPPGHQLSGYPSPPMSETPSPSRRVEQPHRPEGEEQQRQRQHENRQQPLVSTAGAPPAARVSTLPQQRPPPPPPPLPPPPPPPADYAPRPARPTIQYQSHSDFSGAYRFDFPPMASNPLPGLAAASNAPPQTVPAMYESSSAAARGAVGGSRSMRRTKAHVASACLNCKRAHLSCDDKRPCSRCVSSSKEKTCIDVPHKKRGRPRLRDERDSKAIQERPISEQTARFPPMQVETTAGGARRSILQSEPPAPAAAGAQIGWQESTTAGQPYGQQAEQSICSHVPASFPPPGGVDPSRLPIAFLNLDLTIIKANQALHDLIGRHGDLAGRSLAELAEPSAADAIEKMCLELRNERDATEPNYMAPLRSEEIDAVKALSDSEVSAIGHHFVDRPVSWIFRFARTGEIYPLHAHIRLAKTKQVYLATMVVESHTSTPSLLTASYIPPPSAASSVYSSSPTIGDYSHFTSRRNTTSTTSSGPSSPFAQPFQPTLSRGSASPSAQPGNFGLPMSSRHGRGLLQHHQHQHQHRPQSPPPTSVPKFGSAPSVLGVMLQPTSRPLEGNLSSTMRRESSAAQFEHPQLPPIHDLLQQPRHSAPSALQTAMAVEAARRQSEGESRERARRRGDLDPSPPAEGGQPAERERQQSQDTSKRRRLNIQEVLD